MYCNQSQYHCIQHQSQYQYQYGNGNLIAYCFVKVLSYVLQSKSISLYSIPTPKSIPIPMQLKTNTNRYNVRCFMVWMFLETHRRCRRHSKGVRARQHCHPKLERVLLKEKTSIGNIEEVVAPVARPLVEKTAWVSWNVLLILRLSDPLKVLLCLETPKVFETGCDLGLGLCLNYGTASYEE